MTTTAMVVGSAAQVAQSEGKTLAEIIMRMRRILLIDTSYSMTDEDAQDGQRRIDVAKAEMASIQRQDPGAYGIFYFSSTAGYCPTGIPPEEFGSTNMLLGLQTVKEYDGLVESITVISDGEPTGGPNIQQEILDYARTFVTPISTVYIGPRNGHGQAFLKQLGQVGKGGNMTAHEAKQLAASVQKLLTDGKG